MQNITRRYGENTVLAGVDLHIRPGEYAALVGPSGSGKSTLMHILGCLDSPTEGRYFLDGEEVSGLSMEQLCRVRRQKIGFVFQGYQLLPRMTAAENVAFPLMLRGVAKEKRMLQARELLRYVGLAGREDHLPSQLSGGQQQRAAIARALCVRPPLLLCDEPTGALDPESRDEILDLLESLHRDGHTLVLITHDMACARRAGRIIRVSDGRAAPLHADGM